ncbi:acyl-CoA thioesterase [Vaginella massiliensis]|uniref:acyl-CoA thioesterase n=1 Tax=Vaginella massiliensis TaxID=1816680 RepID=UPI0008385A21|nr:acyl-CoA thioesterase [Vaginella massiliensis]
MQKLYFQKTVVRWSDLDANRHLANSSFSNFTSYARIAFLRDFGVTMKDLGQLQMGPAILHEQFSYFKEAYEGEEIYITVEIDGMSDDGMIYSFLHNLYREDGTHLCQSKLVGVWFSLTDRKMKAPPTALLEGLKKSIANREVKVLSKSDLKNLPAFPQNIDPSFFKQL